MAIVDLYYADLCLKKLAAALCELNLAHSYATFSREGVPEIESIIGMVELEMGVMRAAFQVEASKREPHESRVVLLQTEKDLG